MKAEGFLSALGKDDEDDVPRKRRPRKTAEAAPAPAAPEEAPPAQTPAPAPEAASAPPAPEPDPTPAPAPLPVPVPGDTALVDTPELASLIQIVQNALLPQAGPGAASTEPVHKTSVDLRWTLKQALAKLVERDKRGPKAEINEALELWLRVKGIDVPEWNG